VQAARVILAHRQHAGAGEDATGAGPGDDAPAPPPPSPPPRRTCALGRLGALVLLSDLGRVLLMWVLVVCTAVVLHTGGAGGGGGTAPPQEAVVLAFVVCALALMMPLLAAALLGAARGAAETLRLDAASLISPAAWAYQGWAVGVWAYWLVAAVLWYPLAAARVLEDAAAAARNGTAAVTCEAVRETGAHWAGLGVGTAAVCAATLHVLARGRWNAHAAIGLLVLALAALDTFLLRAAWQPADNALLCEARWYWERTLRVGALCVGFFAWEASGTLEAETAQRKAAEAAAAAAPVPSSGVPTRVFFVGTMLALLASGYGPLNFAAAWLMLLAVTRRTLVTGARDWARAHRRAAGDKHEPPPVITDTLDAETGHTSDADAVAAGGSASTYSEDMPRVQAVAAAAAVSPVAVFGAASDYVSVAGGAQQQQQVAPAVAVAAPSQPLVPAWSPAARRAAAAPVRSARHGGVGSRTARL
jgi:hypothetical protein